MSEYLASIQCVDSSGKIAYNPKTMTIDEYKTLSQELRDIIETYEIVVQSIKSNKITQTSETCI